MGFLTTGENLYLFKLYKLNYNYFNMHEITHQKRSQSMFQKNLILPDVNKKDNETDFSE